MQGVVSEPEMEDAAWRELRQGGEPMWMPDAADEMMVDAIAEEEEAELEALISSIPPPAAAESSRPPSLHLSDDEDYDALFADYLAQQGDREAPQSGSAADVDMS